MMSEENQKIVENQQGWDDYSLGEPTKSKVSSEFLCVEQIESGGSYFSGISVREKVRQAEVLMAQSKFNPGSPQQNNPTHISGNIHTTTNN
jgi:hypothetical protein